MTHSLLPLALVAALLAWPAAGQSGLPSETRINERLIALAIGDRLRDVCGSVDARMLRAVGYLRGTYRMARDRGYSDDEIEAYTDDDVQKDRLKAIAEERLAALGAMPGDEASHCAVARGQIAAETEIGRLLRD